MCEEYINIQTGEVLDLEMVSTLPDNAMLKVRPDLWCEWDFEKNDELCLGIWEVTKASGKRAWWICKECKRSFDSFVFNRNKNRNCPYCAGRSVSDETSLITLNSQLASEWHPSKNGKLTPHDVSYTSGKKVWWLGECGHEWEAKIDNRKFGKGCPYCSKHRLLKGFNDMWTTNPKMASLLLNPEDGYKYMQNSNKKLDWRCSKCDEIIKNRKPNHINTFGLSCSKCSDNKSMGEKIIYHLLKYLVLDFEKEKTFIWSNNKRYDFYIPSLNMIIETHGVQHYVQTNRKRARSLKEEQINDEYKCELALQNGIEKYIVIDCRNSDFQFIKNNILNSGLSNVLDINKVNWEEININSQESIIMNVFMDYVNNLSVKELSQKYSIHRTTVRRYLNNFLL